MRRKTILIALGAIAASSLLVYGGLRGYFYLVREVAPPKYAYGHLLFTWGVPDAEPPSLAKYDHMVREELTGRYRTNLPIEMASYSGRMYCWLKGDKFIVTVDGRNNLAHEAQRFAYAAFGEAAVTADQANQLYALTVDAEPSLCPTGYPNPVTKQPNPAELGTTTEANHE